MRSAIVWKGKKAIPGDFDCDVVVCGAGAAGLAAALEGKRQGVATIVLEKGKVANTVVDFPALKKIYAQPQELSIDSPLWIEDCSKEELLEHWQELIEKEQLDIRTGKELIGISDLKGGGFSVRNIDSSVYSCRAVVLAVGRRGNPRKLGVPGEDLSHVHHLLLDPRGYQDKKVLVVGGGNSAVEAANALEGNGAHVTVSNRRDGFYRASQENQAQIKRNIDSRKLVVHYNSTIPRLTPTEATIKSAKAESKEPFDNVFVLIGAEPPLKLLDKLNVAIEMTWGPSRFGLLLISILGVWMMYAFSKWSDGSSLREFPFGLLGKSWEVLPSWINPGVAKGLIYTLLVIGFGIPALGRWRKKTYGGSYQTWRFISIFASQGFFLFIFPEFILKSFDPVNYWRMYGILMPFPLLYEIFFYHPTVVWIVICALIAFVGLPILVRFHGKRLCSWVCGCGCLAETLGDGFRQCAPKGEASCKIEAPIMRIILAWAVVSTFLYLVLQGGSGNQPFYVKTYIYIVDFWLASVIGVSLYFFFGARIWCRYFCPLAHYMRLLSAWFGGFRVKPSDRCIACGECTRYCQMGIDVMKFALQRVPVDNRNSSCIGCDICVSSCPMGNLTTGESFPFQPSSS